MIKSIIITLVLSSTTIYADSGDTHDEANHKSNGHSHHVNPFKNEVNKETIERAAMQEVQRLVAEKKIPKSWRFAPISKLGKTHYGDTDDWVVVFDNLKIKKKTRQTLYIFVSVGGEIRGANYTGN